MKKAEDFNGYLVIWHRAPEMEAALSDTVHATLDGAMSAIQQAIRNGASYAAHGGTVVKSNWLYSIAPGWDERVGHKEATE